MQAASKAFEVHSGLSHRDECGHTDPAEISDALHASVVLCPE